MKATPSPQDQGNNQDIIELLKGLEEHKVEYPPELLAARRAAFVAQLEQSRKEKLKATLPLNGQFLKRLKELKSVKAEYPPELLAARRAAFITAIEQRSTVPTKATKEPTAKNQEIIKLLKKISAAEPEYPASMLAARRATFIAAIEQHTTVAVEVTEELTAKDQEIIKLLKKMSAAEPGYPARMLAARRAAFRRQIALGGGVSLLDALYSSVRNLLLFRLKMPSAQTMSMMRTSLVVAMLMIAVYLGTLFRSHEQFLSPAATQEEIAQAVSVSTDTSTAEVAKVICKPGYLPPLCLAKEAPEDESLTSPESGARPAVAKDTLPGYSGVHKAAYANDGLYGPGASWVSNSPYSWIKIDLGKTTSINMVTFGRDRLGSFNDRDPGQFVIAVALSDNVYADGNSSNDYMEYTQVYDSAKAGFDGIVSGSETIAATFSPVEARFIKITFANPGTAVDEVEAFMAQPSQLVDNATRRPRDETSGAAATALPVYNSPPPQPADVVRPPTSTPIPAPTNTPLPPPTKTPVPPTKTPVPPTKTPLPQPTDTPRPPTNTPLPPPTNTPHPPTNTPLPPSTDTAVPPADTATPAPVDTQPPPPDTQVPQPTAADTLAPVISSAETPAALITP